MPVVIPCVHTDTGWRSWSQGQFEAGAVEGPRLSSQGVRDMSASPRVYLLKPCGVEMKKLPDISVADRNHTENLCQRELYLFH